MALNFGIKALQPGSAANLPHVLGFSTPRSTAGDTLFEIWNGSTNAAKVFSVDKDGKITGDGSGITALNASNLASGTVPPARMGSGTPSASAFLRGDGAWASQIGPVAKATIYADMSTSAPSLSGLLASASVSDDTDVVGAVGYAKVTGAAPSGFADAIGIQALAAAAHTSGSAFVRGLQARASVIAAGAASQVIGADVTASCDAGSGGATSLVGVQVQASGAGVTSAWGILVSSVTGASSVNYAIVTQGTAPVDFGGTIQLHDFGLTTPTRVGASLTGLIYVKQGALVYHSPSGTITTIGPA